ncbi:hypothetical protein [Desulfothermobacter acidiphilus]|uniref:hypothetical protein n=1 Tax=Desulfothermobacter acidiphilus TaxID=1938353 RepID=UPI003F8AA500
MKVANGFKCAGAIAAAWAESALAGSRAIVQKVERDLRGTPFFFQLVGVLLFALPSACVVCLLALLAGGLVVVGYLLEGGAWLWARLAEREEG